MQKILIIDNDPVFLRTAKRLLETHGFLVNTLGNPTDAIDILREDSFNCILLDVKMPAMNGLEVLKLFQQHNINIPVIMISGESTIDIAIQALKMGAYDFIEKPLDTDRLLNTLHHAIERNLLIEENKSLLSEIKKNFEIIGSSSAIRWVLKMVRKAAEVDSKVLITGESGTGKTLIARAIHFQSKRKAKPFVETNCAAIPSQLLESELFGYKKGAFTGAAGDKEGVFLAANGGSVFLDEIGEMDILMQAKLLKVLDNKEVPIIGSPFPSKIDVRIITATNKDIQKLIEEKKFREDLYYRLKVIHIHIPPLRERPEDILPLAYHFLKKFSLALNKPVQSIHPLLESTLENSPWPGNVRELENLIERMVVFSEKEQLTMDDYFRVQNDEQQFVSKLFDIHHARPMPYKEAMNWFEEKYLRYALEKSHGNIKKAAQVLKLDRSNLYKKLRKYGLAKINFSLDDGS
jgi:DNA-binding NtrC family response regulator